MHNPLPSHDAGLTGAQLPGGWSGGDSVFYIGCSKTFDDGDKLVHGGKGEVVGPDDAVASRVAVLFPGNKTSICCTLSNLSRAPPPPLPGGWSVGEQVYFAGCSQTFASGSKVYKLVHGGKGEVVGPDTSDTSSSRVAVLFPGNQKAVNCTLSTLSRAPPPPLPGGWSVGEQVFYTGLSETCASGSKLVYGGKGEVVGPIVSDASRVAVLFPGNKTSICCELSRLSPAPPPPLPGGWSVGDSVFYIGCNETFDTGDKVVHGGKGEVAGPNGGKDTSCSRLAVLFPGNRRHVNCTLSEMSRAPPPPLPGGWRVGEPVYFNGCSQTCDDGSKLVNGGKGEVMGPDDTDASRVAVLFPGNKHSVYCRLTRLSRSPPTTTEELAQQGRERAQAALAQQGRERAQATLEAAIEAGELEALREAIDAAEAAGCAPSLLKRARKRRDALRKAARRQGRQSQAAQGEEEVRRQQEWRAAEAAAAAQEEAAREAAEAESARTAREAASQAERAAAAAAARAAAEERAAREAGEAREAEARRLAAREAAALQAAAREAAEAAAVAGAEAHEQEAAAAAQEQLTQAGEEARAAQLKTAAAATAAAAAVSKARVKQAAATEAAAQAGNAADAAVAAAASVEQAQAAVSAAQAALAAAEAEAQRTAHAEVTLAAAARAAAADAVREQEAAAVAEAARYAASVAEAEAWAQLDAIRSVRATHAVASGRGCGGGGRGGRGAGRGAASGRGMPAPPAAAHGLPPPPRADPAAAPDASRAPSATADDSAPTCVVCLAAPRAYLLLPCGHLCLCEACQAQHEWSECPMCRADATGTLRVYT